MPTKQSKSATDTEKFSLKELFKDHPYFVGFNFMGSLLIGTFWFWAPFQKWMSESNDHFLETYTESTIYFAIVSLTVTWWFYCIWNIMIVKIFKFMPITFWMAYFIAICLLGLFVV